MKLGIAFVTVGSIIFIAWAVFMVMSLVAGDYFSAVWLTIYTGIAGGLSLYSGIKRIKSNGY